MASLPSIPPLLCNTPPPIDFGDDDDDDTTLPTSLALDDDETNGGFRSFAVAPHTSDIETSSEVPSLPHTPVELDSNCFNTVDDESVDIPAFISANSKVFAKPVEAYNLAILASNSPPPIYFETRTSNEEPEDDDDDDEDIFQEFCIASPESDPGGGEKAGGVDKESSVAKNEDNISLPSLKLDTLSISSEKFSTASRVSPSPTLEHDKSDTVTTPVVDTVDKESTQAEVFKHNKNNVVKLEDLVDDSSDDECHSPKKRNHIIEDERAEDFFAIRAINEDILEMSLDTHDNQNGDLNESLNNLQQNPTEEHIEATKEECCENRSDDFNDFTDFADFENNTNNKSPAKGNVKEESQPEPQKQSKPFNDDEDFEDFQDFNNGADICYIAESVPEKQAKPLVQDEPSSSVVHTIVDHQDDDSEDEFGDFSNASFASAPPPPPAVSTAVASQSINMPTSIDKNNFNEKLTPILEMMFPADADRSADSMEELKTLEKSLDTDSAAHLKLDVVDSAKALDYQWTKSEVRHSLIRSLGIDSRNILFGEKWNSSVPRFAANLSFDPLKPLKPQRVDPHTTPEAERVHANLAQGTMNRVRPDVPGAEFDWNSSGLVNPLDGPQEVPHTRETETIHTAQSEPLNAPVDQQPPHSSTISIIDDYSNSSVNPTAAPSAITDTTATASISPIISTDSIGNAFEHHGNNTDIVAGHQDAIELVDKIATIKTTLSSSDLRSRDVSTTFATCENSFNNNKTDFLDIDFNDVVATSTFAGPLKETHIYTPSKNDAAATAKSITSTKTTPIDFDYEIAAAGIIIDEKVVKKEYRDVEYNPGFNLELSKMQPNNLLAVSENSTDSNDVLDVLKGEGVKSDEKHSSEDSDDAEFDDEFTEFQSVPPTISTSGTSSKALSSTQPMTAITNSNNNTVTSGNNTPTPNRREMILSPSILLPQAIPLGNSKPKIEWGDTALGINPEELARIEELFPQTKMAEINNSHKSTPKHNGYQTKQVQDSLSISAAVAQKELQIDDDDWSEFVSVPAVEPASHALKIKENTQQFTKANNNNVTFSPKHRMQQQLTTTTNAVQKAKPRAESSVTCEEEWSDFMCSAPPTNTQYRTLPQFNSAAWQNANFYNNPLSLYQSQTNHVNVVPKVQINNNSMSSNCYHEYNKYCPQTQQHQHRQQLQQQQEKQQQQQQQQQHLQLQQQIHIMPDFSTAPPSRLHRSSNSEIAAKTVTTSSFQMGSAKVAPSISLIPDLGFIAPAAPTHTALINTFPKPSFSARK